MRWLEVWEGRSMDSEVILGEIDGIVIGGAIGAAATPEVYYGSLVGADVLLFFLIPDSGH